jgi:uncharacterized protein (TIGR03437 family)
MFGKTSIPAQGSTSAVYGTNSIAPPETVLFSFAGLDANGYAWSTTATAIFNGPARSIASLTNGASFDSVNVPVGSPPAPPDAPVTQQSVFAPGMVLTLFGQNGGLSNFSATGSIPLPTYLVSGDGSSFVTAAINGTPAPLYFVSPMQVNLQIPYELQSAFSASVTSVPAVLTWNDSGAISSYSFTLQPVSPGIFAANGVWNLDAQTQAPVSPNSQSDPVPAGDMAAVYYTGAGVLAGTLADGVAASAASPAPLSRATLTLTGNGISPVTFSNAAPANTATVALVPGTVGVAQAVFRLPSNLKTGEYKISVGLQGSVGSGSSATLLPGIVTGNSVSLWIAPCTRNCSD